MNEDGVGIFADQEGQWTWRIPYGDAVLLNKPVDSTHIVCLAKMLGIPMTKPVAKPA
jgi:hypothetical protein